MLIQDQPPQSTRSMAQRYVWLDADPGYDDAIAIMLAIHSKNIHLLGVSTVHGNTDVSYTSNNAARCLFAFGAPSRVLVYPGAPKPLLGIPRHAPEIHGVDGLEGVEGLPGVDHPEVRKRFAINQDGSPIRALEGMANAIKSTWDWGTGNRVTIVSTGPFTNIALFFSVYPELVDAIDELVSMGGGVGLGNRTAVAEFNIRCDPHAAQIVLDTPIRKTMIPLNVTHTAIVTRQVRRRILSPNITPSADGGDNFPEPSSHLRHTLFTLINFFTEIHQVYGFKDGPPVHDALTIAYVSHPSLFTSERFRVDIELTGAHTLGETVVDPYNRTCDNSWGPLGKNCIVAKSIDVDGFFALLLDCLERCDESSPLNVSRYD